MNSNQIAYINNCVDFVRSHPETTWLYYMDSITSAAILDGLSDLANKIQFVPQENADEKEQSDCLCFKLSLWAMKSFGLSELPIKTEQKLHVADYISGCIDQGYQPNPSAVSIELASYGVMLNNIRYYQQISDTISQQLKGSQISPAPFHQ